MHPKEIISTIITGLALIAVIGSIFLLAIKMSGVNPPGYALYMTAGTAGILGAILGVALHRDNNGG